MAENVASLILSFRVIAFWRDDGDATLVRLILLRAAIAEYYSLR